MKLQTPELLGNLQLEMLLAYNCNCYRVLGRAPHDIVFVHSLHKVIDHTGIASTPLILSITVSCWPRLSACSVVGDQLLRIHYLHYIAFTFNFAQPKSYK